eukprot:scaffold93996_cov77-Phaeocystis_antarctica.AAC.1
MPRVGISALPLATLVVVEVVQKGTKQVEDKYRLACASGTIMTLYTRSYIQPLPGVSPEVMGLQIALDSWRGMPEVGLREAMLRGSREGWARHFLSHAIPFIIEFVSASRRCGIKTTTI